MSQKFLITRDVCTRYGRSDRTIDRWIQEGVLPKPVRIQKLRYWDKADLDQRDEARKAGVAAA